MSNTTISIASIVESVAAIMGEGYEVLSRQIVKNGVAKDAVIIKRNGENIAPTIYVDDLDAGEEMSADNLACKIVHIYNSYKEKSFSFDLDAFIGMSPRDVLQRVQIKLVSVPMEGSVEVLEGIYALPIIPVDLDDEHGTIVLNSKHCEHWNLSVEEAVQAGIANLTGNHKITNMMEIFIPMMYVGTNADKCNGATVITDTAALSIFAAEKQAEVVAIIPSSIHECILIPMTMEELGESAEYLCSIIGYVNASQVIPEERLSNNLYAFYSEEGIVKKVC